MRGSEPMQKRNFCHRYMAFLLLCFVFTPFPLFATFRMFVFNPESQISRGRFVKLIFEASCKKVDVLCSMQIFAKSVDFENVFSVKKPEFSIVASYYYKFRKKKFRWSPLFSGYKVRKRGFRKALLSQGKKLSKIRYISAVSIGGGSINPIEQNFISQVGRRKIFVTKVSKEIDAIMGLALSQVDGAIVSMKALRNLNRINSKAAKSLKQIKILPMIEFPKTVAIKGVKSKTIEELRKVLSNLANDKRKGRLFFAYFGVTEFR